MEDSNNTDTTPQQENTNLQNDESGIGRLFMTAFTSEKNKQTMQEVQQVLQQIKQDNLSASSSSSNGSTKSPSPQQQGEIPSQSTSSPQKQQINLTPTPTPNPESDKKQSDSKNANLKRERDNDYISLSGYDEDDVPVSKKRRVQQQQQYADDEGDLDGEEKRRTVFLGNLHPDVTEDSILQVFKKCGDITGIRLKRHKDTGKVKGYGFIEFKEMDGANKAVEELDGAVINGRELKVEFSKMSRILPATNDMERAASKGGQQQHPRQTSHQQPHHHQQQHHPSRQKYSHQQQQSRPSQSQHSINHNVIGQQRGYQLPSPNPSLLSRVIAELKAQITSNPNLYQNFINMTTGGAGTAPMSNIMSNLLLPGGPSTGAGAHAPPHHQQQQQIMTHHNEPRSPEDGGKTVFVGNLSYKIKEEHVRNVFRKVGEIKQVRWLTDKATGKFRGCAFVEFYDSDAAQRAVELNDKQVLNRPMRVAFATERNRDD